MKMIEEELNLQMSVIKNVSMLAKNPFYPDDFTCYCSSHSVNCLRSDLEKKKGRGGTNGFRAPISFSLPPPPFPSPPLDFLNGRFLLQSVCPMNDNGIEW